MGIKEEIKQSSFESNRVMSIINVFYTANWLRDKGQPIYKKHGILSQHYNILRIVKGKYPKPVSPGDIKDVMLDKGRDLTRLIDKLVSLGFVERKLCEHNRRKMEITITAKGLNIVEAVSVDNDKMFSQLNLSEDEALQLSNLLDKIRL